MLNIAAGDDSGDPAICSSNFSADTNWLACFVIRWRRLEEAVFQLLRQSNYTLMYVSLGRDLS